MDTDKSFNRYIEDLKNHGMIDEDFTDGAIYMVYDRSGTSGEKYVSVSREEFESLASIRKREETSFYCLDELLDPGGSKPCPPVYIECKLSQSIEWRKKDNSDDLAGTDMEFHSLDAPTMKAPRNEDYGVLPADCCLPEKGSALVDTEFEDRVTTMVLYEEVAHAAEDLRPSFSQLFRNLFPNPDRKYRTRYEAAKEMGVTNSVIIYEGCQRIVRRLSEIFKS